MTLNNREQNSFALNAAIGFLSILLFILILALLSRFVYPRIINERADLDPVLISSIIQIEVLNGCGIPGLATKYTSSLRRFGFDVVETGNFDNFDLENTLIISRTGNLENARRVARALGVSEDQIITERSPDFYLDVTIVLGSDYTTLNL
ncbi:MAG: LytR C-terminal domain-containing protein [Balneolaceae bacterium]